MGVLLIVVGSIWVIIGAGNLIIGFINIFNMDPGGELIEVGIFVSLFINVIFFILPGWVVVRVGKGMRKK